MESSKSQVLVAVDFRHPVEVLTKSLSYPELPTFDIDVVLHSFIESLTHGDDFEKELLAAINDLVEDDHLIENPEWTSHEEEVGMKHFIRNEMMRCALEMHQQLRDLKMLTPGQQYTYKRPVNTYVHLYRKSATSGSA